MKKILRREADDIHMLQMHPVLRRIYSYRGITTAQELEQGIERLLPFQSLLNIDTAVSCIAHALKKQKKFLIVGDFDADGATSTAVAVRALRSFGAKFVDFLVPNRFEFGYGLTPELVEVASHQNPDVIITVDNGIANHAGVIAAKNLGMEVVITDHHLPSEQLPPADAIVNPNQSGDLFPSKNIAGVGVIFYVMLALRRHLSEISWFSENHIPEPNMSRLLDLVALGTVADVVALDQNNRILVHQGVRRIRQGLCVPGLTALLELGGRNQSRIIASDLGYVVAPRLNAAGRLDDMSLGIDCLLCDDLQKAREIAKILNQLNEERRVIEQDMQEQALYLLKNFQLAERQMPMGLCLFNENWHQGVIGILASRIKDKFQRPVIAFALANEHELKGSARSVPGLHIRDVLAQIASQKPDLISKFGGHAMAAGLTIPRAAFDAFAIVFEEVVSTFIQPELLNNALMSDGELAFTDLTLEVAQLIRDAGPWGQAFPEPLFDGIFRMVDQRLVSDKHLKMTLSKEDRVLDAIAFHVDLQSWPNHRAEYVNIAYRLDVNEFRGKQKVQLIVEHMELM